VLKVFQFQIDLGSGLMTEKWRVLKWSLSNQAADSLSRSLRRNRDVLAGNRHAVFAPPLILVWSTIAAILDLIRVKIQRPQNENDRPETTPTTREPERTPRRSSILLLHLPPRQRMPFSSDIEYAILVEAGRFDNCRRRWGDPASLHLALNRQVTQQARLESSPKVGLWFGC
jgi:hypothetical protein